ERFILKGRCVNWRVLEPIIAVSQDHERNYEVPKNPHGTHVASTLCGDVRAGQLNQHIEGADPYPETDIKGVCPELEIFDLRVCDELGVGSEFTLLAALQFIGHLNRDRDKMRVQGANISLAVKHDLRNFACGRTPVCLECNRLVASGVVVVAAAGNAGVSRRITANGAYESYDAISITDPGNAQDVITVGATHKREPHTYGISYFSSRGPTGDGRLKPDIVAPGEKILAAVPGRKLDVMDGTSMAAPHVSGAAAALMARHRELIRQPDIVKSILCDTATDLKREKRFQGAGLVDVLRAIQSV
ncbi:MAG: S8 family serine peptidase, partial [Pseudomonadota bacterium]